MQGWIDRRAGTECAKTGASGRGRHHGGRIESIIRIGRQYAGSGAHATQSQTNTGIIIIINYRNNTRNMLHIILLLIIFFETPFNF
jgi:hypothetical protein